MELLTTQEYLVHIDRYPRSIYVLHEKSERRFPVHYHTKGQLTYVEGGIAYVHTEGNIYVIPARHYIWIPGQLSHFLQMGSSASAIRTIYFHMDIGDSLFYQHMGIYPINNLLHEMILYTGQYHGDQDPQSKPFTFLMALKNLLPESDTHNLPIILPTTQNQRLQPVLQYLNKNAGQVLTLDIVSSRFGLSERSLSRLFQSVLSISFLQYLKQLRMVKAVEMMLQTDFNLSQIAYATGYGSISAFSNTFYQLTQMRPSVFVSSLR